MKKLILLLILCPSLFLTGCVLNSTGKTEVGVRTVKFSLFGEKGVEDKIYPPGSTTIFLPFINDWHTFDTKLQNLE
ncbi:MAG: prohibitin family protein, partial [Geopsychrobacter sp.]|nr:prohibitin family protein [Geopsychrobacter sp.]